MRLLAYDPYINEEFCAENGVKSVEFDELLSDSDFIVLAMPLTDSTYHMINADSIAKMKDGVIIANDARGGVVDAQAMVAALKSGKVGFYATDVTDPGSRRRPMTSCSVWKTALLPRIWGPRRRMQRIT